MQLEQDKCLPTYKKVPMIPNTPITSNTFGLMNIPHFVKQYGDIMVVYCFVDCVLCTKLNFYVGIIQNILIAPGLLKITVFQIYFHMFYGNTITKRISVLFLIVCWKVEHPQFLPADIKIQESWKAGRSAMISRFNSLCFGAGAKTSCPPPSRANLMIFWGGGHYFPPYIL
jgi:hypothetical protein